MNTKLNKMFFSQNSLEIFSKCRLRFKKRYVDGLWWHSGEAKDSHAEKGRLFHLMAYRYFMGLDDSIDNEEIRIWQERLKKYISISPKNSYYPEYELRLSDNDIKLQAKYDLVAIDSQNRAVIYDWKVQDKPIKPKTAETAFQTRVYRYLLAKAGDIINGKPIKPEDITMIYWQANHPETPVVIGYSEEMFNQDEEFLKEEIKKILSCRFDAKGLKTADEKACKFCEFCSICNGFDSEEEAGTETESDIEWEDAEEIEF